MLHESHPGGCTAPGFTDMWNKLYTNQGTILEPLLKELTELVAARQDSEEIRQLDKEIKDISGQSQILKPSHEERIWTLLFLWRAVASLAGS